MPGNIFPDRLGRWLIAALVLALGTGRPAGWCGPDEELTHRAEHLLSTYVDETGLVDYAGWKAHPEDAAWPELYLHALSKLEINPEDSSKETLALLLNAYNVAVLQQILARYPMATVQTIPKFFTAPCVSMAGKRWSLNELEEMVRHFEDGRVHAALCPGARSSPPLSKSLYRADLLDEQLNRQMAVWLGRLDLNPLWRSNRVVVISKIFNWYKQDFGTSDEALFKFVAGHSEAFKKGLPSDGGHVEFIEFDWRLNEQKKEADSKAPAKTP